MFVLAASSLEPIVRSGFNAKVRVRPLSLARLLDAYQLFVNAEQDGGSAHVLGWIPVKFVQPPIHTGGANSPDQFHQQCFRWL